MEKYQLDHITMLLEYLPEFIEKAEEILEQPPTWTKTRLWRDMLDDLERKRLLALRFLDNVERKLP